MKVLKNIDRFLLIFTTFLLTFIPVSQSYETKEKTLLEKINWDKLSIERTCSELNYDQSYLLLPNSPPWCPMERWSFLGNLDDKLLMHQQVKIKNENN